MVLAWQLLAMNLQKLTNKAGASIEDVGPPSGVLESLGPFITGTRVEEEDVVSQEKVSHDGRMVSPLCNLVILHAQADIHQIKSCSCAGTVLPVRGQFVVWLGAAALLRRGHHQGPDCLFALRQRNG